MPIPNSELSSSHRQSIRKARPIRITLPYRPPLDWPHLLDYFRSHQIPGVETISETAYERIFRIGSEVCSARISYDGAANCLLLEVRGGGAKVASLTALRVRRMCDLDLDPSELAGPLGSHHVFREIWEKHPGLRMGTGWDPFETAVATILGQLVSVSQARALLRQLVECCGEKIDHPVTNEPAYLFPSPAVLASAGLMTVRTSPARRIAIREMAMLVSTGELDLTGGPATACEIKKKLLAIPGIGPWSAEYIGLRALGHADSFPRTDLFIKRALQQHLVHDLNTILPWRGYLAVYLWKDCVQLFSKARKKPAGNPQTSK